MSADNGESDRYESYAALSREALEARLKVAEDVCVIVGWCALDFYKEEWEGSERADAAMEMWSMWCSMVGGSGALDPEHWPDVDALIPRLAAQRRETRAQTLARIKSMGLGIPDDGGT